MSTPDGKKLGSEALKSVNKKLTQPIIDLSKPDMVERYNIARFPTRLLSLNYLMSGKYGGGIPLGRIIEIVGYESVGKTTLLLQILSDFWEYTDEDCIKT